MSEEENKCNCGSDGCECKDCKCKECGMPISKEEEMGTDENGKKTCEHCVHCMKDGKIQ